MASTRQGFAALVAALGAVTSAAIAQDRSGAEIYAAACAACHGADGRGRTRAELGFDVPLADFTDCDFAVREPDSDWAAVTHNGGPARGFDRLMPAFGEALSDEEIAAALEHVRGFCTDERWPRGELNLPRALFTEKAYPEDEAVITTSIATEGPSSLTHEFLWEQRFGPRNQMEIGVPLTRADIGPPEGRTSGTGDLFVAVKRTVRHSFERGSIFSIGGELILPTGDEAKGFGRGTTVFEPFVTFGKILPRDSFVQVHAFAEFPASGSLEDELGARVALGRTWTRGRFGRAWTPIVEVLASRELGGGGDWSYDLVPQFQVTLSTRQHVMANAGVRVPITDRSARTTEVVFYLLWDWFDGGVLEGW